MANNLYYGDNLQVLRNSIANESVDLIYLDPPFNSDANYNVLFQSPEGKLSAAQIEAFEDTWHWTQEAEQSFDEVMQSGNSGVAELLRAMRSFLRENDMMAYLTMMSVRLLELYRVLKSTGSLYLHCDSTANNYLKILLDAIFGVKFFRNEIVWKRTSAHNDPRKYGRNADRILFYTKSKDYTFHPQYIDYDEEYLGNFYRFEDNKGRYRLSDLTGPGVNKQDKEWRGYHPAKKGRSWSVSKKAVRDIAGEAGARLSTYQKLDLLYDHGLIKISKNNVPSFKRYLKTMDGAPAQEIWADINPISSQSRERLGYPTQKPLALLERIIKASSNEGDVVLDPFCGCGTAVHAAEKLKRQWVGIDITHLAVSLIEKRLRDAFSNVLFDLHGTPKDIEGAQALARQDKYQFQWWAVSLVQAVPYGGKKKGADGGIDGFIYFKPDGKKTEKAIVSVKGGDNVSVAMIRDLAHVIEREDAKIGLFITLADPTAPMLKEAAAAGFYQTEYGKYAKIQIMTIATLFEGKKPDIPLVDPAVFKKAQLESRHQQGEMDV